MIRRVLETILLAAFASAGCSSSGDPSAQVAKLNDSNLKRVGNLYGAFQEQNGWVGPKDEAALKEFTQNKVPARNLEMMGIDPNQVDVIFLSERDGKPLKVRYGVERPGGRMGPRCAVVFEETGAGGRRQVGFTNGSVEEVDDSQYAQLWQAKPGSELPSSGGSGAGG